MRNKMSLFVAAVAVSVVLAWASSAAAIPVGNNYTCYQIKDLKIPAKIVPPPAVFTVDQFQGGLASKCKPKLFCTPASVDGGPIVDVSLGYFCYQCKADSLFPLPIDVTDQYTTGRVQLKKFKFVCNPATSTIVP